MATVGNLMLHINTMIKTVDFKLTLILITCLLTLKIKEHMILIMSYIIQRKKGKICLE